MQHYATCALMCILSALTPTRDASALPNDATLTALTARAQTAFERGQTEVAIRLYLQAYNTVDRDPSLLYNVAFIYEQTGRIKEADDLYRQVARAPRATADLRVKAYERRDQLPAVSAAVPLLNERVAPVTAPPPVTAAPQPVAVPVPQPRRPTPTAAAPPKTSPSAAPKTKEDEGKDDASNRRLSPEQRRRLELRRRRARAARGG